MARAYGSSAHLLMKRETVYGQAATGDYTRMPFNRCNLGSEQGLIDDPVLGQGRDPLAPLQDVINDEGDVVVPLDPRYLGLWLTGLFGDGALPCRRALLPGVHAAPGAAERRKKRIRALCRWHFQPGAGPEYCKACRDDGLPCARGEPGADGRLCPYRVRALISRQEHEAWDVLLACQGQLRLAPSGHVVGIDMNAALKIGAARGYDLEVLSELLPAAEAGLVETLCGDRVRDDGLDQASPVSADYPLAAISEHMRHFRV